MCDCYWHDCAHEGCREATDWHIEDFNYDREEFRIWCHHHWRKAPPEAIAFVARQNYRDEDGTFRAGDVICAAIGPEVTVGGDSNTPNFGMAMDTMTVREAKRKGAAR